MKRTVIIGIVVLLMGLGTSAAAGIPTDQLKGATDRVLMKTKQQELSFEHQNKKKSTP